jgi:hypothetical protein
MDTRFLAIAVLSNFLFWGREAAEKLKLLDFKSKVEGTDNS